MPSETPMVLYCHASIFCCSTDFLTMLPSSSTFSPLALEEEGSLHRASEERGSPLTMCATRSKVSYPLSDQQGTRGRKKKKKINLLARVPFPPHRGDANLGRILHHIPVGNAGGVEHGLEIRSHVHQPINIPASCSLAIGEYDPCFRSLERELCTSPLYRTLNGKYLGTSIAGRRGQPRKRENEVYSRHAEFEGLACLPGHLENHVLSSKPETNGLGDHRAEGSQTGDSRQVWARSGRDDHSGPWGRQ